MLCSRKKPIRIFIVRVPRGRPGTLESAKLIGKLIADGAKDFRVRQKAIDIFRRQRVPAKNRLAEIHALFEWVRRNIRYTRDIFQVETLHTARRMLELKAGDCDDMAILLGAMLKATGHPVRLCLVGFRRDLPHLYSHIYPEVQCKSRWIALDATMRHPMGWAPPAVWKSVCDITKDGIQCSCVTE